MSAQLNKLCQLSRQVLLSNCSRRGIYTESYLGIEHYRKFQKKILRNRNPQAEIQRIQQDFKKFGIHGLKKHDANDLSLFSSNDQDMVVLHEILTSYLNTKGDPKMKINCVSNCHNLCYIRKDVTYSRLFTKPPFLKWLVKNPIAQLCHLTLLYDVLQLPRFIFQRHSSLPQAANIPRTSGTRPRLPPQTLHSSVRT